MEILSNNWRDIGEFPNYEVNEYSQIRNKKTEKILSPFVDKEGYTYCVISKENKRFRRAVYRVSATAFHGPPPTVLHHAAHNDGNSRNNYYKNIRWATLEENNRDKKKHGTEVQGERNPRVKLTRKEVLEIKQLNPIGRERKRIAERYKISYSNIVAILKNKTWSCIYE